MASRNNEQDRHSHESAAGLSHSTPLVRLPAAPVVSGIRPLVAAAQQSMSSPFASTTNSASGTVSVTDHPLAMIASEDSSTRSGGPLVGKFEAEVPAAQPVLSTPQSKLSFARTGMGILPFSLQGRTGLSSTPLQPVVSPIVSLNLSVDDMVDNFLAGVSARTEQGLPPVSYPEPLPSEMSDLERLKMLMDRRAWGDVSLVTERLLRGTSSHYAPIYDSLLNNTAGLPTLESQQQDLVWIMTVQCEAWVKTRRYTELALEIERWGFCHHNDNTAPSWVPWSLHILAASSLLYTSISENPAAKDALDALWAIRQDIPEDDPISKLQVEHAISNVFIRRKEWRMALSAQQRMLGILHAACKQHSQKVFGDSCTEETATILEKAYQCEILSRQGRVLLQLGALTGAPHVFKMARDLWTEEIQSCQTAQQDGIIAQTTAQLEMNEGLLCFSEGKYTDALEFFRRTVQIIRQSGILDSKPIADHSSSLLPVSWGIAPVDSLYSETINNMSICALYTCRLREALLLIESLVREDPTRFLTERVALNLCTLYELSNDTSVSARKKRIIQLIAKRFMLQDIGQSNFRI